MTPNFQCDPIGEAELASRRSRALDEAESRGLDGLLVWARCGEPGASADIQYFADHFSPFPWVPPAPPAITACEHAALVLTRSGATLAVSSYVSPSVTLSDVRSGWDLDATVHSALHDHGLSKSRVGVIGPGVLPYTSGIAMRKALPSLELVDCDDISHALRRRLSAWEIQVLRTAGQVGATLAQAVLDRTVEGATEGDVVGAGLACAASIPHCNHWSFLVGSADMADRFVAADLPAWRPHVIYRAGDVMHFDCYGMFHGYPYDLARTTVVGKSTPAQERAIHGARRLCETLAAALTPGITARTLHRTGVEYLAAEGLHAGDLPGFGHGLACGFVRPYFLPSQAMSPDLDLPLEPPMGVAFETFLSDGNGHYGAWEEDYVWLEGGNVELLTIMPDSA